MKYKILYLNLFPEIGGAETSLIYLIKSLNKKLFTPEVIVPEPGQFSQRLAKISAQIHFLHLTGYLIQSLFIPGINPISLLKFYKLCRKIKPDLIHLNHITQAIYAGVTGKMLNVPVLATSWMNSDSVYFYQDILSNLCINKILAITPEIKQKLIAKKIIKPDKVQVAFPGINTNYFVPAKNKSLVKNKLGISKTSLVVTIASRFDPVKDQLTFLKAMNLVLKKVKNLIILIAQDPQINLSKNSTAKQIKLQIDQFLSQNPQLQSITKFIGYQKNILPIYQATDILVSSSLYESLGMILMEAASCELPIVSTNFNAQHHVVINNKTGFLVPIKRPKIMAKKILTLAKDKTLRTDFGKEARKYIQTHFDINDYAQKIQLEYVKLINKKLR